MLEFTYGQLATLAGAVGARKFRLRQTVSRGNPDPAIQASNERYLADLEELSQLIEGELDRRAAAMEGVQDGNKS